MDAGELQELSFACAACGERNELLLDPQDGARQETVVDCWVCCRPNRIRIRVQGDQVQLDVSRE